MLAHTTADRHMHDDGPAGAGVVLAYETVTPNPSTGTLLQMVQQNDDKHEDAHKRLRDDFRDLHAHLLSIEERIAKLEAAHAALDKSQINFARRVDDVVLSSGDISKWRFTPSQLVAIVAVCASVIAGGYASTYGVRTEQAAIRSDLRDLIGQMNKQVELNGANAKLQDERAASMKEQIDTLKRESQLWKYDMQTQLKDILEKIQRQRR